MNKFKRYLTYDFWWSEKTNEVELKYKILGFLLAILISAFAYFILRINNNRWDKRINEVNSKAEIRQTDLMKKAVIAEQASWRLARQVAIMQESMRQDSIRQSQMNLEFTNGIKEIEEFKKNEKIYVPDNTAFDEQFRYISTVKYKPIKR